MICLYDQNPGFEKEEEIGLPKSIEASHTITQDKSEFISFYKKHSSQKKEDYSRDYELYDETHDENEWTYDGPTTYDDII